MKARAAEIATVTVLGTLSVAYCLFYYHLNDDGYSIYSGQLGFLQVPSIVFRTFVSQGPVPVAGASSVS